MCHYLFLARIGDSGVKGLIVLATVESGLESYHNVLYIGATKVVGAVIEVD